jgi:hypothetical protein
MKYFGIILILLMACSSPKNEGEETTAGLVDEEMITVCRLEFTVSNFQNWLEVYMMDQDERKSKSIETLSIYSDVEIEDRYHVFISAPGFTSLESYLDSESFHNSFTIPASEVSRDLIDVTQLSQETFSEKYRILLSHKILDYLSWKPIFDSDEDTRKSYGLKTVGVGRAKEDPNLIYVMFAFDDEERALEYIDSNQLKERMQESGVVGELLVTKVAAIEGIQF